MKKSSSTFAFWIYALLSLSNKLRGVDREKQNDKWFWTPVWWQQPQLVWSEGLEAQLTSASGASTTVQTVKKKSVPPVWPYLLSGVVHHLFLWRCLNLKADLTFVRLCFKASSMFSSILLCHTKTISVLFTHTIVFYHILNSCVLRGTVPLWSNPKDNQHQRAQAVFSSHRQ